MDDDCENEVDILGEYDSETSLISNNVHVASLSSSNTILNNDISSNLWCTDHPQDWLNEHNFGRKNQVEIEQILNDKKVASSEFPSINFKDHNKVKASPTHKKAWTQEEKNLFSKGLELYGRKWTHISRYIGTRTSLQVKNYARQYIKNQEKLIKPDSNLKSLTYHENISDALTAVTTGDISSVFAEEDYVDKNCSSIEPLSFVVAEEIVHIKSQKNDTDSEGDIDICEDSNSPVQTSIDHVFNMDSKFAFCDVPPNISSIDQKECVSSEKPELETLNDFNSEESSSSKTFFSNEANSQELSVDQKDSSEDSKQINAERITDVYENSTSEYEPIYLKPPEEEIEVDYCSITDQEKLFHKEFFEGRTQKTPERYMKIRNYIIDSWLRSKPSYLNKTSVRPGLKNCGDVNCIGRIHQYLEQIGAINFGCEQARYNRPMLNNCYTSGKEKFKDSTKEEPPVTHSQRVGSMRSRKRKQPTYLDDIDVDEGYTMTHDDDGTIVETVHAVAPPKLKPSKYHGPNPFRLVPCKCFTEDYPEPYSLEVSVEAITIADIHCHTVHTEVMGLLGGRYDRERNVLQILSCEACESMSTGVQCEMDPVSQTLGMEALLKSGFEVVGWYHSHPTFVPDPSVRDIETQIRYQDLFKNQGGNPFIAMIISPFYQANNTSITRCFIVKDLQTPINFEFNLIENYIEVDKIFSIAEKFIQQSSSSTSPVNMMSPVSSLSDVTYLDAMLNSLEEKLVEANLSQELIKDILLRINRLVLQQNLQ